MGRFLRPPRQVFPAATNLLQVLEIDEASREAITAIDSTLLTPIIGHKGHPDIAIDADDLVQIAWDDTRGGKVEIVSPIDTSGSCTLNGLTCALCSMEVHGPMEAPSGIKPMLQEANISVFETLYALGGFYPSAATSGACANQPHHENPRANHLDIGDDSGGLIDSTLPSTTVAHRVVDTKVKTGALVALGLACLG